MSASPHRLRRPASRWSGSLAGLAALILGAVLLWRFPALPGSDDALFLARGVEHFSVLAFSPNFPGYPGMIWLARLLAPVTATPFAALFGVSLVATLAMAWLAGALYRRLLDDALGGLTVTLLILATPLTGQVAISGLTDGPGLCLLLLAGWLALRGGGVTTGLAWGLGGCVRPTYALLWLAQAGGFLRRPGWPWRRFVVAVIFMVLAALAFVWQADGHAYVAEGWRFVMGHFLIWGEAAGARDAHTSWPGALREAGVQGVIWALLGLVVALATPWLTRHRPALRPWLLLWWLALAWTALAQNPQHLRHLLPLVALGGLLAVAALRALLPRYLATGLLAALLLGQGTLLVGALAGAPRLAPVQQAIAYLRHHPGDSQLVTHHEVELLRAALPRLGVTDAYYHGDAAIRLRAGSWRLVSTAALVKAFDGRRCAFFPARLTGDTPLWLVHTRAPCPRKQRAAR
ncbi:hypothetical protein [Modicisalibacter coralii]|uniref:hypothetical protein n=1 Tax=Modicisalibacter coralii TaxID=2304602 RepID=UPI00100BEE80|nr:hypothetical protein [Halomonas coralii]